MTAMLTPGSRELDHRHSNGIDVALWWIPDEDALLVTVFEESGDSFELAVEAHEALDVFHHPYAHAAQRRAQLLDVAV